LPVHAVVGKALLRAPRQLEDLDALVEASRGLGGIDAETVELVEAISPTDAEVEAAARQHVDRRGLLGEQRRHVPRKDRDGGSEAQRRRASRQVAEHHQRGADVPETREVMLDEEGALVAEVLGGAQVVEVLGVGLLVRPSARTEGAPEESEPHRCAPAIRFTFPILDRNVI
jgi:hypothetical protein